MSESIRRYDGFDISPAIYELETEIAEQGNLHAYVESLKEHYADTAVFAILEASAGYIEPVDRTTGLQDSEYPAAKAFFGGATLGLRTIEFAQGTDFVLGLNAEKVRLRVPSETSDTLHWLHTMASTIQAMGDEGYELAAPMHQRLDEWDIQITQDPTTTAYFKRGFGFTMHISSQVCTDQKRAEFAAFMDSVGIFEKDWSDFDKAFTEQEEGNL